VTVAPGDAAPRRVFVDSDNALGSASGDIDDGIALAVLLKSGLHVEAIASVFGNTSAEDGLRNNAALAELCGFTGPCLAGASSPAAAMSEAAKQLADGSSDRTFLGLGPLTNVAQAMSLDTEVSRRFAELICLGSNARSRGRWPPLWPFEYNFTKDRVAAVRVFESSARITVVPLDQACRLRLRFSDLADIEGELGVYLRRHARRWFRRAGWLKLRSTVPVWDLVACMYLIRPELFSTQPRRALAHENGWIQYDAGERWVSVITGFDPRAVWSAAVTLLNRPSEC